MSKTLRQHAVYLALRCVSARNHRHAVEQKGGATADKFPRIRDCLGRHETGRANDYLASQEHASFAAERRYVKSRRPAVEHCFGDDRRDALVLVPRAGDNRRC